MKFTLFILALITSVSITRAQIFEGKILYQSTYKSKIPNMTDEQLSLMMGANQEYIVKGGNYKTVYNGTLVKWSVFINADQKIYSKLATSDALLWNDVTENKDEVIKSEIKKNVISILGYACDELTITSQKSTEKYYYHSELKSDPAQYASHKFGHWDEFTKKTKSVPLKMIISNEQFTIESTATEILPMKLDDSMFTLPAGVKTEKSPY